jgi:hypothetical protein
MKQRTQITVDRRVTQALGPGRERMDPLRIWRGAAAGEACDSVAIGGGCLLRYDPARPTFGGHTLAIIAADARLLTPLTASAAREALASLEAAGRPAYVHVNSHRVAADRRNGTASPIIAVRLSRGGRPTYVTAVAVRGPSWLICCPERAICGAKVYLVVPRGSALRLIGQP